MNTKVAIILVGVSGSGKSGYVNNLPGVVSGDVKVVSKDIIRRQLFEYDPEINFWDQYTFKDEKKLSINSQMNTLIELYANQGSSIVIDNTNLSFNKNTSLEASLKSLGYDVHFVNLNLSSDMRYYELRNKSRLDSISSGAINDQYVLACKSGYIPFEEARKPNIAIVDLDGTVALKGDRTFFEFNKSGRDLPNTYVIDTIKALLKAGLIDYVQFLSGRESYSYDVTYAWLQTQGFDMDLHRLLMRSTKDHRKDYIIKKEIYENCIENKANIFAVFDDRPQVIDLWWDLKLPVFHVGDYRIQF